MRDVSQALHHAEVIERYPKDFPYPSYLMLGWVNARPIHVVAADNQEARETIIITVYEPDLIKWEEGFKRRRL